MNFPLVSSLFEYTPIKVEDQIFGEEGINRIGGYGQRRLGRWKKY
jgi:hypothetical protein